MIASGAVLLTLSVALMQTRFDGEWGDGVLLVLAAATAAVLLALGTQRRPEAGAPPASDSVLLLAGLTMAFVAIGRLAEVLGSDDSLESSEITWMFLAFGAIALWPGVRKRSAASAFVAALAFGGALLAAWDWLFEPDSITPFRWLLLVLAVGYVAVSLALRGSQYRHSELLVSAAGLAMLAIALVSGLPLFIGFGLGEELPGFWEGVLVVSGCGLLAYAAADKVPGPAVIGLAVLAAFVGLTTGDEETLLWWPLLLGGIGLLALLAGLRPRAPLPPQPEAIPAADLPLAARSRADETVIRVRDET